MTTPGPLMASAQRALQESLQAVPADKDGALVAVATESGARLALAVRVGDRLRFGAWLEAAPKTKPAYGAAVEFTWP